VPVIAESGAALASAGDVVESDGHASLWSEDQFSALVELSTKENSYASLLHRPRSEARHRGRASAAGRAPVGSKSGRSRGRSMRGRNNRGRGKQPKSKKQKSKKSKRRANGKSKSSSSFRHVSADAVELRSKHKRGKIHLSKSQLGTVNSAIHLQDKRARKPSAKLINQIDSIKKAVKHQRK
jgi:hypothetical protein